jgi:hypothetical protein
MPIPGGPFAALDATEGPLAWTDVMHVVFEWAERAKEDPNLEAELTGLHLGPSAGTSAWGTRYGPWATLQKEDGTQVFIPERARINAQMLGAWKQLARAAKHPYLRFRFADLVWDLATVASEKREVEFARLAADAALEGLRSGSFKFEVEAFKVCVRALELAKMINDDARGLDAERALFAYERSHGKDLHEATWGYALTRILDKESRLPPEEQAAVVLAMEERFARLLAMEPHPHTLQAAAVPLADLYRRQGRADDVARVLRAYANAVVALGRRMSGMLAASFLHRVHALLDDYGLREEAAALGSEMREQGQRSVSELRSSTKCWPARRTTHSRGSRSSSFRQIEVN